MPESAVPPPPGRFTHAGVLALTVAVFGAVVALVAWQQRSGLREQIMQREAGRLAALATMQLNIGAQEMGEEAASVPGALLVAVLKTMEYGGVLAVRVFDAQGAPGGSDGIIGPDEGRPAHWDRLSAGESVAHLHRRPPDDDVIFVEPLAELAPLLEIWVPLRRRQDAPLLGVAQFWLRGDEERAELARHDRRVWTTAAVAWFAGSLVIGAGLAWSFRKVDAANAALRARSEDLQRANRELILAAKTSALGAVTAHLMHELKSPLAGLEVIVAGQGEGARGEGGELAAASELTRRLRTMVNDVVGVLRDEQTGGAFELSCADIVEVVAGKVRAEAAARHVTVVAEGDARHQVAGRRGNLAILILRNLVQNAIEAAPAGSAVQLHGTRDASGAADFVVQDAGPGLRPALRARLFQPCTSTKAGGSGVGLALSYQLAQQAGGRLELVHSDERGTAFRLVLPAGP